MRKSLLRTVLNVASQRTVITVFLMIVFQTTMVSQSAKAPLSNAQQTLLGSVPRGLPSDLLLQLRPVGTRLQLPGKEETVLAGQLVTVTGERKNIRVVHQLSGMVRIEGIRERAALSFDGDFAFGNLDRTDETHLETFVMDSLEGMIYSARSGGAVRLLGRGFGPDPRSTRDYNGPRYDIFEVAAPVRSRQDRQLRVKRYYFDSATGLLVSTRYLDPTVSSGLKVETRFLDWQQIEGSAYPGRIERYEDGRQIFSILVSSALGGSRRQAADFR